jgi:hypothetical protein
MTIFKVAVQAFKDTIEYMQSFICDLESEMEMEIHKNGSNLRICKEELQLGGCCSL